MLIDLPSDVPMTLTFSHCLAYLSETTSADSVIKPVQPFLDKFKTLVYALEEHFFTFASQYKTEQELMGIFIGRAIVTQDIERRPDFKKFFETLFIEYRGNPPKEEFQKYVSTTLVERTPTQKTKEIKSEITQPTFFKASQEMVDWKNQKSYQLVDGNVVVIDEKIKKVFIVHPASGKKISEFSIDLVPVRGVFKLDDGNLVFNYTSPDIVKVYKLSGEQVKEIPTNELTHIKSNRSAAKIESLTHIKGNRGFEGCRHESKRENSVFTSN